jgi:hypothetical protein
MMPFATGGYEVLAVPKGEEVVCDGCGMVMHGLGHYYGTAREGKSDVFWRRYADDENGDEYSIGYCEECWEKATGQIPLDDVGPQEVDG